MQNQPLPIPVVRAVLPIFLHISVLHNNSHRLTKNTRTDSIVWDKLATVHNYV